jgi:hypothetical protein
MHGAQEFARADQMKVCITQNKAVTNINLRRLYFYAKNVEKV